MKMRCEECGKVVEGKDELETERRMDEHWDRKCPARKKLEAMSMEELRKMIKQAARR